MLLLTGPLTGPALSAVRVRLLLPRSSRSRRGRPTRDDDGATDVMLRDVTTGDRLQEPLPVRLRARALPVLRVGVLLVVRLARTVWLPCGAACEVGQVRRRLCHAADTRHERLGRPRSRDGGRDGRGQRRSAPDRRRPLRRHHGCGSAHTMNFTASVVRIGRVNPLRLTPSIGADTAFGALPDEALVVLLDQVHPVPAALTVVEGRHWNGPQFGGVLSLKRERVARTWAS